MHDRELSDADISDDLQRAHGQPPEVVQPVSYPRLRAHPGPVQFPARETLATLSGSR